MKAISVRDLQKQIKECLDIAQTDKVVITRYGKPAAVIVGVENLDWATVVLEMDKGFWKLIQKRRGQKTISIEAMRKTLNA